MLSEAEKADICNQIGSYLQKREEVVFAYLFGSFSDPEMPSFRDIDVDIFIRPFSEFEAINLEIEISEEIEKLLKRSFPVDVIVINSLSPLFARKIITGKPLFTKDENLWLDFVVMVSMKADDIAPVFYHFFKEAYLEQD